MITSSQVATYVNHVNSVKIGTRDRFLKVWVDVKSHKEGFYVD